MGPRIKRSVEREKEGRLETHVKCRGVFQEL